MTRAFNDKADANKPVKCTDCEQMVWSHNMASHYAVEHAGKDIPSDQ